MDDGVQEIAEALRSKGWPIPDEVQTVEHLVIAIKASDGPNGDADGYDADDRGDDGAGDDGQHPLDLGSDNGMLMSTTRPPRASRSLKRVVATQASLARRLSKGQGLPPVA